MRIIIIKEYYTYFCLPLYRRYVHRKLQLQIEMQNMPRYIFYSLHVATEKFKCQVKLTYFKALDCKSSFLQHQRWRASIISFQDQVSPPWHTLILKWKFRKKDRLHGIPIDEDVTARHVKYSKTNEFMIIAMPEPTNVESKIAKIACNRSCK